MRSCRSGASLRGSSLCFLQGHKDEIVPFVTRLSRDLDTSVQFFFSHRVTETHAWVMATRGAVVRAFAYSGEQGETLINLGTQTDGEKALNQTELADPNEETVMQVAGKWGIDPQTLDQQGHTLGVGLVGRIK